MKCFVHLCLLTVMSLLTAGCSGEQFETAAVTGTVTSGGNLIPEGTIIFSPIATGSETMVGKSATGAVKDGKFVLSTYVNSDGAVVGEHSVMVTGKEVPPKEAGESEWGSAPNWGSTTETFKVIAGVDNSFEIQLTPPAKKKRGKNNEEDDD